MPLLRLRLGFILALVATIIPCYGKTPHTWLRIESDKVILYSDAEEKEAVDFAAKYTAIRRIADSWCLPQGASQPLDQGILFASTSDFEHLCSKTLHARSTGHSALATTRDETALFATAIDKTDAKKSACLDSAFITGINGMLRRNWRGTQGWILDGVNFVFSTVWIDGNDCVIGEEYATWPKSWTDDIFTKDLYTFRLMFPVLLTDPAQGVSRERFFSIVANSDKIKKPTEETMKILNWDKAKLWHALDYRWTEPIKVPIDIPGISRQIKVSQASELEVSLLLSYLQRSAKDDKSADETLAKAEKSAPNSPLIFEAYARKLASENRPAEAAETYRKANSAGSTEPWTYLWSASLRLDALEKGQVQNSNKAAEVHQALDEIRHALTLNSDITTAYELMARCFCQSAEVTPDNIKSLSSGVLDNADGMNVRYYRALLFLRLGQTDESLADLRQIIDCPYAPKETRDNARTKSEAILFDTVSRKIRASLENQDFEGAQRLIDETEKQTSSETFARVYMPIRHRVAEQAALTHLATLTEPGKWTEFEKAANAFLHDFPDSALAPKIRAILADGARDTSSGDTPNTKKNP